MKILKQKLLQTLKQEETRLNKQRESLIERINEARSNQNNEDSDLIIYNYASELKFILTQTKKLNSTISNIETSKCESGHKIGDQIKIGDCVKLENPKRSVFYFITNSSHYVDPSLGIISSNSPLAEQILNNKFGDEVIIGFNGNSTKCKLLP